MPLKGSSFWPCKPLGYFDKVIFINYKCSAGRGELGLPGSQGKQASQIDERLIKIISRGWVQLRNLSVNPPWLYPRVAVEGARESGMPFPTRVSPHLGMPR
jgi:hypothetical protein